MNTAIPTLPSIRATPSRPSRAHLTAVPTADNSVAPLLANFYRDAPSAVRLSLVRAMLRPVGPLALVAIAAGAFARLLPGSPSQPLEVTTESVGSIGPDQVFELARYVEQKAPEWLACLPELVGTPDVWLATVSGALLLVALQALRRPRG